MRRRGALTPQLKPRLRTRRPTRPAQAEMWVQMAALAWAAPAQALTETSQLICQVQLGLAPPMESQKAAARHTQVSLGTLLCTLLQYRLYPTRCRRRQLLLSTRT